jgi:hypothetical protein
MPDIHDMELDARPSWSEIYSNVCEEHGDEHVRNIIVNYKDLKTNQKTEKYVEFCMECCFDHPGENQYLFTIGDNNEQIKVRSDVR